jgi:hypothetical protein
MQTHESPIKTYGREILASKYAPLRSVVGEVTRSAGGNVILRVGREDSPGGTWHRTEHVVVTPAEACELVHDLTANVISVWVEHGDEDKARQAFGDEAVDAWFRASGIDPNASREGW